MPLAVWQSQAGRPAEVLTLREHPAAERAPDQLRVRVLAAPVLPMDHLRIRGHYPLAQTLPGVPGSAGVGRVTEGPAAWQDALVCLPLRAGSWADEAVVPIDGTLRLPDDADPVTAALLRVDGLTAQALLSGLERDATVLLNAANGGVGLQTIQLAARMGVRAIGVVRRDEARDDVLRAGAIAALVDGPDLAERVQQVAAGPIHRALDAVGGDATARLGGCLARGGRVLHYGAMSRQGPRLEVHDAIFRGVLLQGFWLHRVEELRGSDATAHVLHRMLELGVRPRVDSRWPLAQVHAALARDRHPERRGRVVFTADASGPDA